MFPIIHLRNLKNLVKNFTEFVSSEKKVKLLKLDLIINFVQKKFPLSDAILIIESRAKNRF